MLLRKTRQGPPAPQAGTLQTPPRQTWSPVQLAHGSAVAAATQRPLRHVPAVHTVPSGSVPLHVPCVRFVQGGHGFFLRCCFLALPSSVPNAAPTKAPSPPPVNARPKLRRDVPAPSDRASTSK